MSELYFEGSVVTLFEAAKKAGQLAAQGKHLDIHCGDAVIEAIGQGHALLREHNDGPQPVGSCPDDPALVGEKILELCDQPQPVGADVQGLDPATISLILQLMPLVLDLFKRWRS